jgi:hypothetical protein
LKGIKSNNNPTLQPNANVTPVILSSQSINYEDEEELNSWIWKSNAHAHMAYQKTTNK